MSFDRGLALAKLGYRVMVLIDADKPPTQEKVDAYLAAGERSPRGGPIELWKMSYS